MKLVYHLVPIKKENGRPAPDVAAGAVSGSGIICPIVWDRFSPYSNCPNTCSISARLGKQSQFKIQVMNPDAAKISSCLIAESDRFIAKLLLRYAEGSGMICERAWEGADLLALVQRIKPDVIILDAEFPGSKVGWETMRDLKADNITCGTAIISCSWLSQSEVRSLGGDLTAYLQKPNISYTDFEKAMMAAGAPGANYRPARQEDGDEREISF